MNTQDTIIAPATALGGGIAIIRLSGSNALSALDKFFRPSLPVQAVCSHYLYHGHFLSPTGEVIDEVMVVYMATPRSYTAEDVVEIHCHGSQQVVKEILNIFQAEGLRLAAPGEFTYRAFINGRIDLSQAEGVASLIQSSSESARKISSTQVEGALSRAIHSFAAQIKHQVVFFEAWIDFPEEDVPPADLDRCHSDISALAAEIDTLCKSFNHGKILRQGASILLVGRPNVGKSSLLNFFLGEDRAIVTDTPGTTRDLLEEGLTIQGMPVRLIDTAGIRMTTDPAEREGVKRAEDKFKQADLVLVLLDSTAPIAEQDRYIIEGCRDLPHFFVWTKADLCNSSRQSLEDFGTSYNISTKTGEGIDSLRSGIVNYLLGDEVQATEGVLLSEQRHYEALLNTQKHLRAFLVLLETHESIDLLSFELREALHWLGQISGETTTESLLDDIFSSFCIGK